MYKKIIKRGIDIIVSLILLIFLFFPFLIISIFIKLDSKGDIFFRQVRIGKNGNFFKIFKFRTMVSDAEKKGGYSTTENDERITRFGKFLRKSSLDELPQILNILLGDMSLIGPRPDVPAQRELYTNEEFIKRHQVLPGITGLAQARKRHSATVRERKKYDIFYNKKISFMLDLKIILWTLKILKKGSY